MLDAMMVVGALLGVALALALRSVVSPRWTAAAMCAVGAAALVARVSSGPTAVASITAIALGAALLAGFAVHAHRRAPSVVPATPPDGEGGRRVHLLAWAVPALVAVVVYSTWSITRHEGFGSGAWDLGIFVHSTWLVAHGAGFTSSVLGDVNFLGDHFSPIWLLAAPLSYLGGAEVLLLAQAILIAAAAWPLALLARRAQLGPLSVSAITIAYLFSMGTLSCAAFDVHEIAPVPLFMLFAVYGFQVERRVIAYPALLLLCSCKESAILYAAAIGAWLLFTVRGRRLEGLAVGAACTACFFLVVGVVQPALLAGGPQGMIHLQRFSEFGDTLSSAAGNMLLHPGKTLLVLVSPAEKIATLQQTLGTFGLLPLLSPGTLLLASANLMERFLSNKREMWGIGFHYSLPLTGVCAFASVLAAARVRRLVEATFVRFLPRRRGTRSRRSPCGLGAGLWHRRRGVHRPRLRAQDIEQAVLLDASADRGEPAGARLDPQRCRRRRAKPPAAAPRRACKDLATRVAVRRAR